LPQLVVDEGEKVVRGLAIPRGRVFEQTRDVGHDDECNGNTPTGKMKEAYRHDHLDLNRHRGNSARWCAVIVGTTSFTSAAVGTRRVPVVSDSPITSFASPS